MIPVKPGIITGRSKIQQGIFFKHISPRHRNIVSEGILMTEPHGWNISDSGHRRGYGIKIGNNQVGPCSFKHKNIRHKTNKIKLKHRLYVVQLTLMGNKSHAFHHPVWLKYFHLSQILFFSPTDDHINIVTIRPKLSNKLPATADMAISCSLNSKKDLHTISGLDLKIGILHHQGLFTRISKRYPDFLLSSGSLHIQHSSRTKKSMMHHRSCSKSRL